MIRVLRWWLLVGGYVVALHFIGATSAHAQTSTPTPTATSFALPSPTVTATPQPGTPTPGPGDSTIVWGCEVWNLLTAVPVCTWSDYFEVMMMASKTTGDGEDTNITEESALVIIPPSNTRRVEARCSVAIMVASRDYVPSGATGQAGGEMRFGNRTASPTYGMVRTNGAGGSTANVSISVSGNGEHYDAIYDTQNVVWEVAADAPQWPIPVEVFPARYTGSPGPNKDSYIRIELETFVSASGSLTPELANHGQVWLRAACVIDRITRLNGTTYKPTTPRVGDLPDWVCDILPECADDEMQPFPTPVKWISTPEPIDFGVTPIGSGCYTLLPGFDWGPYTVFGNELEVSVPEFEICTTEYTMSWQVWGYDFGVWATGLIAIIAMAVLYSRFK